MDTQKILDALDSVKKLSMQFAPIAVIADACDGLSALVNHEGELRQKVADLQAEVVASQARVDEIAATEQTKVAAITVEHDRFVAEYAAHRDRLREEAQAAEDDSKQRIEAAKQSVRAVEVEAVQARDTVRVQMNADVEQLTAAHTVFKAQHAAKQAAIGAQTAQLQSHLDTLKNKVSPLLT